MMQLFNHCTALERCINILCNYGELQITTCCAELEGVEQLQVISLE
jgi:hypothetical protein